MAKLNLKYYDGQDHYSDGDIECVILDMVKKGKNFTDAVGTNDLYPIMYHLSRERENILNWYPFKKTDHILEVGAGCGAITGLLCRMAGNVTSVELSKRRSEINYERNKDYDNLEIIVGNLNDIPLCADFDYVILNGVFEYAIGFTEDHNPYAAFLNRLMQKLKISGKILIAIENRIGVKYFSGAMEDHTNDYFIGLNGYRGNHSVRTFSKSELEKIFTKCGLSEWKFYYPYPDYKFPTEIFTDENVNKPEYGRVYRNYQNNRIHLFDELDMISTLKSEGVMGFFSNSFLVELMMGDALKSDVVYAKMNVTRKEKYCISTVIFQKGGEYFVKKIPLRNASERHIKNIYENQFKDIPHQFAYLKGDLKENMIIYPYIRRDNLDAVTYRLMYEKKQDSIKEIFDNIYDILRNASSMRNDIYQERFIEYFGNRRLKESTECIYNFNIDIIFDNLYKIDDKYMIIDPEWVLEIWIPVKFIFWRMLNEWYSKYDYANTLMPKECLYSEYGITVEDAEVFRSWAVHFANQFVSNVDLDDCVSGVENVNFKEAIERWNSSKVLESSLFIDYGNGFGERDKYVIKTRLENNRFYSKVILDSNKQIQAIRWDPIEFQGCRCSIDQCMLDGKEVVILPQNAEADDASLFLTLDPKFSFSIDAGYYHVLELSGKLQYLKDKEYLEIINKFRQHINILKAENDVYIVENRKVCLCNEEMKSGIDKFSCENERLQSDNEKLQLENKNLQSDNKKLQLENKNLQSAVKNMGSKGWKTWFKAK